MPVTAGSAARRQPLGRRSRSSCKFILLNSLHKMPLASPRVNDAQDDRSNVSIALAWASRVITISMTMAVPGIGGYWLDSRLGTRVLFTLLGVALGMTAGIWQLLQLARSDK